ncbi:uncharacterized protein DSM5745_07973 [Aspergillus mulundensis]|uniref:Uncharacterized protein n=1 Tax=Aspergillus mulundensis TaxID=1810919 RepID=A0A3D8R8T1_9EURO|nr:hypothetical protein DSM5745_07973 [Aspergillus mulundensis]RDW70462.1 hypothetical protein DSM5745_07973 [Aspergillus mulundensis]
MAKDRDLERQTFPRPLRQRSPVFAKRYRWGEQDSNYSISSISPSRGAAAADTPPAGQFLAQVFLSLRN